MFAAFIRKRSNNYHHVMKLLVIILMWSLFLVHSFSYFFSVSLLLLVETSVKYLFPLISSMYPFILLIIRYKGFALHIFTVFLRICTKNSKVFDCHIFNEINVINFCMTFHLSWFYLDQDFILIVPPKKVLCTIFNIDFFYTVHFILIRQ